MAKGPLEQWVDEPVDRTRLEVERKLQQLVDEGYFDDLPGRGKPIDLSEEDNPFIPADMRLAYRILRNAGIAPAWIELGNEIAADVEVLERQAAAHRENVERAVGRLRRMLPGLRRDRYERLKAEQETFLARYAAAIDETNKKIDLFNSSTPIFHFQKNRLSRRRLIEQMAGLLPADPEAL